MNKYPTNKSRAAAYAGIVCILIFYMLKGWFSPPVPIYISYVIGTSSLLFMFLARYIRQQEGVALEIPSHSKPEIEKLANIEVLFALISGISVFVAVILVRFDAQKIVQQRAFCVSTGIFALNGMVSYWIFRKSKILLSSQ